MEEDIPREEDYIDESLIDNLQSELQNEKNKNIQLATAISGSSMQKEGGIIQYQIETAEMLEKLEHFLRGDIIDRDEQGNVGYRKPDPDIETEKDLIVFNDFGVNSIMLTIGNYIDKNTTLSFYKEERINEILSDLGTELTHFIFCNYEKMGMDTEFKKSKYPMIVVNILHIIESAYRRALEGREKEIINTANISYSQPNQSGSFPRAVQRPKTWYKPSTW